jgi:hypothetical protein
MSRRRTARTARTSAAARTPRTGAARRGASPASAALLKRVDALEAELAHLRGVRRHFDSLLQEYHRLVSGIGALHASKAAKAFVKVSVGKPLPAPGRKRFRLTKAALHQMYDRLAETCRGLRDWTSREDICRAAGFTVAESKRAFAMCVQGFQGAKGKVKPLLKSNGKVGRVGRYRKAA